MTLRPLTFDFTMRSTEAVRTPHDVPLEEILREMDREAADRATSYPRLVRSGRLRQLDGERQQAIWGAIRDDVAVLVALSDPNMPIADYEAAQAKIYAHDIGWATKVREARRELALRRNVYPDQTRRLRLAPAEARRRLECADGLHWHLFVKLLGIDGDLHRMEPPARHLLVRGLLAQRSLWLLDRAAAGDAPWIHADALPGPMTAADIATDRAHLAKLAQHHPEFFAAEPQKEKAA